MSITFPKDLLIIDFESSHGGDHPSNQPVQIGAVLLDGKTLDEKKAYSSFIHAEMAGVSPDWIAKKGYDLAVIAEAPDAAQVAKELVETFGKEFFLTSWVAGMDRELFRDMMKRAGFSIKDFDFHVYDLWPVAYTYLLEQGYKGGVGSEEMFQAFGLPSRGTHDALEDCRHEAEVLRKIIAKQSVVLK